VREVEQQPEKEDRHAGQPGHIHDGGIDGGKDYRHQGRELLGELLHDIAEVRRRLDVQHGRTSVPNI